MAHLVRQCLQLFGQRRRAAVEHSCAHQSSERDSPVSTDGSELLRRIWLSGRRGSLPTVEFGCFEAILVKTSFQLGLAKCVLTCRIWWSVQSYRWTNGFAYSGLSLSPKLFPGTEGKGIVSANLLTLVPETMSTPCLAWFRACTIDSRVVRASRSS